MKNSLPQPKNRRIIEQMFEKPTARCPACKQVIESISHIIYQGKSQKKWPLVIVGAFTAFIVSILFITPDFVGISPPIARILASLLALFVLCFIIGALSTVYLAVARFLCENCSQAFNRTKRVKPGVDFPKPKSEH